jgi:predicted polyphosphate/ATP-dependent NAD kinase
VRAADAVIAVGGGYGTLSEIALALRAGTPVIGLDTWDVEGVRIASDAEAAVQAALS